VAIVVVVLLLAGAGGAYAWKRITTKPLRLVPALVHQTPTVATQKLQPLHLRLQMTQAYSLPEPKGQIISQRQPPGTKLREDSAVAVVVSLGPPPVTVPDLTGLSENDAENRLIGAMFKVGTVSTPYSTTVDKGIVISWTGSGGQLPEGSTVNLVVSNGPPVVAVPSLGGDTFDAAAAALNGVNLKASEDDEYNNTVPKGQVISSSPSSGTTVTIGTTVTVVISKGPHLVAVPNVASMSVLAATNALQAQGFAVSGVMGNPAANVTKTQPAIGTMVLFGSAITLLTS
jgi:serine/threonine-protein kinase